MSDGPTRSRSPSATLVEALADAEGVAPTELNYTLYEYLEPDAVDTLMNGRRADCRLRITVAGHAVTIDGAGTVTVDGTEYRWDDGNATADSCRKR